MSPSETAGFDLSYEGLVAAHAEPDGKGYDDDAEYDYDDTWALETLRVHGADVLADLKKALRGLIDPIMAQVTVDGRQVADGRVWFTYGYGEGSCCAEHGPGGMEHRFTVGADGWDPDKHVDVLTELEKLHGGEHHVRITGQGWVFPLVDVTFAHHTSKVGPEKVYVRPGERVVLPVNYLSEYRYRVTPASRERIEAAERLRTQAERRSRTPQSV